MKRLIGSVLMYFAVWAGAADLYRWTDPETGKIVITPDPPTYSVKASKPGGTLPNGNIITVILDENSPQYKAAVAKKKAVEDEQKRAAQEQARAQAAKEAEQKRLADEQAAKERQRQSAQSAASQQSKAEAINTLCNGLKPLARATAKAKQQGVPLSVAETVAIPKSATPESAQILRQVVRSVYQNNLSPDSAETIVFEACRITYGNVR